MSVLFANLYSSQGKRLPKRHFIFFTPAGKQTIFFQKNLSPLLPRLSNGPSLIEFCSRVAEKKVKKSKFSQTSNYRHIFPFIRPTKYCFKPQFYIE